MARIPTSNDMHFNRACPVCGRSLLIRVQLLGQRVYCQHCGGGFVAVDESLGRGPRVDARVDALLARASAALGQVACGAGDDAAVRP